MAKTILLGVLLRMALRWLSAYRPLLCRGCTSFRILACVNHDDLLLLRFSV